MSEPVSNTKCRDSYPDIASCWRCLKRGREAVAVKAQVQQPVVQEDHRPERQQLPPRGRQEGAEQTTHHPLKFPGHRSQWCHSAIYWSWSRARRGCLQSCKPSTLVGWLVALPRRRQQPLLHLKIPVKARTYPLSKLIIDTKSLVCITSMEVTGVQAFSVIEQCLASCSSTNTA